MDQSPFDPRDGGWTWWTALIFADFYIFFLFLLLRYESLRLAFREALQLFKVSLGNFALTLNQLVWKFKWKSAESGIKAFSPRRETNCSAFMRSLDETNQSELSYFRKFSILGNEAGGQLPPPVYTFLNKCSWSALLDAPMVDKSVGVDQWSKCSEVPQHIFVFPPLPL